MHFPTVSCTDLAYGELSSILTIWVVIYSFLQETKSIQQWYSQTEWMFASKKLLASHLEARLHIMYLWVMSGWELPAGSSATTHWLTLSCGQEFVQQHAAWSHTEQVAQPAAVCPCSCQCGSPTPWGTTAHGQGHLVAPFDPTLLVFIFEHIPSFH